MGEGAALILHGPAYSAYVRVVLLMLHEKGLHCELRPLDLMSGNKLPHEYLKRHPFARVPLLQHGDFELYETAAIAAYLDERFPQPPLQPAAPHQRARLRQIVQIIDNYGYWPMVREVFVQRVLVPRRGGAADEAVIASGLDSAQTALAAIERLAAPESYLAGPQLTLADLHLAPMVYYFTQAPEGAAGFAGFAKLVRWWSTMKERPSVKEICAPLEML